MERSRKLNNAAVINGRDEENGARIDGGREGNGTSVNADKKKGKEWMDEEEPHAHGHTMPIQTQQTTQ